MLHLIFQSPTRPAIFERIAQGDDVVFLESAVFQLMSNSIFSQQIQTLVANNIHCYALREELETRGINIDTSISLIDYSDLVKLTEKNKRIKTWS